MCCFSGPVEHVGDTRIFARSGTKGYQFLAYQMDVKAAKPVAMILPVPTSVGSPEHAVQFINLKQNPHFFEFLNAAFPEVPNRGLEFTNSITKSVQSVEVVPVGSFVASFVPTVADFGRLDRQFRLPDAVWASLPGYKDFGFVVFQLKPGEQKVHPMAFQFPRRNPQQLFFPTVHIHDGQVHPQADFDHVLYCQRNNNEFLGKWGESPLPLGAVHYLHSHRESFSGEQICAASQGLLLPKEHVYRYRLRGHLPNQDHVV